MKKSFLGLISLLLLGVLGCVVPFESARMLPKGKHEVRMAGTYALEGYENRVAYYKNAIGLGYGYGFSHMFNFKLRMEANNPLASRHYDRSFSLSLGPKFSLKRDKWALYVPASVLVEYGDEFSPSISLGLLYTPKFNEKLELNFGLRTDVFIEGGLALALNAGTGLGKSDFTGWMFRPDLGFVLDTEGEYYITLGVAADYRFGK